MSSRVNWKLLLFGLVVGIVLGVLLKGCISC
jgi:uncharacterized membrane-anchored protein YhcB (DUF1043 family)